MNAPPLPDLAQTTALPTIDCLVIGGGQSGLMCGYLLGLAGAKYRVVDASVRVGDAWRNRPRNLRLFTSRQFCRLADVPLAGDPNGYPSGREFADYLERFALDKAIEISLNARVTRLSRANGIFATEMADGTTISSHTVIDATGPNQSPVVPAFAAQLDAGVRQLVAKDFRDADDFPPGSTIAVVGDGASGRQIARELASGRRVYVARGKVRNLVPNTILGRDLFWWLSKIGVLFADRDSLAARLLRKRDPIPASLDSDRRLAARGIVLMRRVVDARDDELIFENGSRARVDAVIWCAGYNDNLGWIALPLIDGPGSLSNDCGRTPEEGFYVVGRKWLTCRASELILGIERDATKVVGYALAYAEKNRVHRAAITELFAL